MHTMHSVYERFSGLLIAQLTYLILILLLEFLLQELCTKEWGSTAIGSLHWKSDSVVGAIYACAWAWDAVNIALLA